MPERTVRSGSLGHTNANRLADDYSAAQSCRFGTSSSGAVVVAQLGVEGAQPDADCLRGRRPLCRVEEGSGVPSEPFFHVLLQGPELYLQQRLEFR